MNSVLSWFLNILQITSTAAPTLNLEENATTIRGYSNEENPFGTLVPLKTYTAWTSRPIYSYLAIKYAESPSGSRRFLPPMPYVLGPGEHFVNETGRPCPVLEYIQNMTDEELKGDLEDCLHLSVHTKDLQKQLPVMFYIHGGAFTSGSSSFHPPNYLLENEIVLVVPQYRLGPLGFLSTQTNDVPGDAALLDIVLALTWTQKYISLFGGDPNQVTIFGQSSGGAIVSALLLSPTVPDNLFHRAIIQSGSALSSRVFDFRPLDSARDIAQFGGCNNGNVSDINLCLKSMDLTKLLKAYNQHFTSNVKNGFTEHGGAKLCLNSILPKSPFELLRSKTFGKNIPVMGGVVKHDGVYILAMIEQNLGLPNSTTQKYVYIEHFLEYLGINDYTGSTAGIFAHSFFSHKKLISENASELTFGLVDIAGDVTIKAPLFNIIEAQSSKYPSQTYLYTFDYKGEFSYSPEAVNYTLPDAVQHADDLLYLFPFPLYAASLNADDTKMAKMMVNLWTSFAINGTPTTENMTKWPSMTGSFGPYLHINEKFTIGDNFLDEYFVAVTEELIEEQNAKELLRINSEKHEQMAITVKYDFNSANNSKSIFFYNILLTIIIFVVRYQ